VTGYIRRADLLGALTYISAAGTQGVDFSLYSGAQQQSFIDRASQQIDAWCKQTFLLTNVQTRYTGNGTNMLRLRHYPLAQLPDSVFTASGNASQSLVADTTFTAAITQTQITNGIATVQVADVSSLLVGQYLQWCDVTTEPAQAIITVTPTVNGATSGPGSVTLKSNLTVPHPIPPANLSILTARIVVNTIDFLQIVLPGSSAVAIPTGQLVVDAAKGEVINYTPLMFQNLGYATIFPRAVPLLLRYTYGYPPGQIPATLQEVCLEQCRRIAIFNASLGAGIKRFKVDDQQIDYEWNPVPLGADLQSYLGRFRRNVGMF
jgi:hypothetical protein